MSEGYNIAKRNNDDLKEEVSDETCFSPPLSDHPIPSLAAIASLAPSSPPNSSCQRPPLPLSPSCKDSAFTGKLLSRKRRIVHMILFSFEVDTLEIHLRETSDLVDHYFLVEATITHKGENKPILWERLRFTERFSFLKEDQVIHVVVDHLGDNEAHRSKAKGSGTDWWFEHQQTEAGVKRVKDWAAAKNSRLDDSDIFISGNADEVLSRSSMHSLAHCQLSSDMTTGALWMPMGDPTKAFQPDWTVRDRPHSFHMPSIYTWGLVASGKQRGERHFAGSEDKYVLGGVHMTNIAFLPNALLKEVTGTEYHLQIPSFFNDNHDLKELDRQQGRAFAMENHKSWRDRRDPISSVTDVPTNLPWWLACHPARYPYWFGRPDPRNKQLLKAMQSGERKKGSKTFRISDIIK